MQETLLSILLVDDDSVDVQALQREFKKNNIFNPLFVAHDGLQALDMLRGENGHSKISPTPRIILLDVHMPRMNGIEFLKEVSRDEKLQSARVFVLTSSADDRSRIETYNLPITGYISKPVTVVSFIRAVATLKNFWKLTHSDEPLKKNEVIEVVNSANR